MNAPITRRQALAALAASPLLLAAQPPKKKVPAESWVGWTVLPWDISIDGVFDREPFDQKGRGSGPSFTVKAEKGGRVLVLNAAGAGYWVEKDQLVPLDDAVQFFTERAGDTVAAPYALNSRGWAYRLLGERERAVKDFDQFLKGKPNDPDGLVNRGLTLAELGKYDAALSDLKEVDTGGSSAIVLLARTNIGYVHELKGEYAKAVQVYKNVLESDPRHLLALNNLAWVTATCPDDAVRDWATAVGHAKRACDATRNLEGMYLDTLAAAMAEAGKFDDAVKTQELALKDKSFDNDYGKEARERLALYKAKKPYRTAPSKK